MNAPFAILVLAALTGCATSGSTSESSAINESIAISASSERTAPEWDFNATIIEACSCTMFCQCYFNSKPSGPGCCSKPDDPLLKTRFCRFNNAFQVNHGTFKGTKLDGVKFWIAGDLGDEFSDGQFNWAVLHFDPAVKKEQRDGITTILGSLYPAKWDSFTIGEDAPMEWKHDANKAEARLAGGKMAEVVLVRNQGMTDDPIVIKNMKYWGAPRNDGFVLMANQVEAYRAGSKAFEFKGTNGFMITLDMNADDVIPAKKGY